MDREELLDQVAALALGILSADEARRVRMQIALDEGLMAEYRAYRRTADLIGYAAEPDAASTNELQRARMKSNVMKSVRASLRAVTVPHARAGIAWPAYAVTAAALVGAFVATIDNVSIRRSLDAERRVAVGEQAQVADLFAADSKHYAVRGGEVVTHDGRVYLALRSLPKLPPGKVFQAWTLAPGAKAVAPSITFTPTSSGGAIVQLPNQHELPAAVAVSIEPQGGSRAPTSTPTFIRKLS